MSGRKLTQADLQQGADYREAKEALNLAEYDANERIKKHGMTQGDRIRINFLIKGIKELTGYCDRIANPELQKKMVEQVKAYRVSQEAGAAIAYGEPGSAFARPDPGVHNEGDRARANQIDRAA